MVHYTFIIKINEIQSNGSVRCVCWSHPVSIHQIPPGTTFRKKKHTTTGKQTRRQETIGKNVSSTQLRHHFGRGNANVGFLASNLNIFFFWEGGFSGWEGVQGWGESQSSL